MATSENFFYSLVADTLGTLENRKAKIKENELTCCCPFHDEDDPSFGIDLHKGVYHCFTCSEKGNMVQFVSKLKDIPESEAKEIVLNEVGFIDLTQIPYSLEQFSDEKKLPIEFLKQHDIDSLNGLHITFPYYDEENNMVRVRYRNNPKSDKRFFWNTGNKLCLYGLWKLQQFDKDYIVLVEGETDSLSLWYHNIPALGVPGAANFKKEYSKLFKDFDKVIIHLEDDEGAKTFMKQICQSGIPFEKLYKVSSKSIDENCKDPSALHIKDLLDESTLLEHIEKINRDYFDEVNRGKQASKDHVIIADKVLEQLFIKYYKSNFYVYDSGVYKEGLAKIEKCILDIDKNIKKSMRTEILDYLRISEGVEITDLDTNLINFKNGIYHRDTKTLEPHTPSYFTLCQVNAYYLNDEEYEKLIKSSANVPIDDFFESICCGHSDRIDTLYEYTGYSMLYSVKLQKCLFLLGETADNGKSTFNELILTLFGSDNCCSISISEFAQRFFGSELQGKLLNVVHEVENIQLKDLANFKTVISGNELSVEQKYKDRYKLKPFTHHIFAMNTLPNITNGGDEGYFRRILIVPFEAKFTDEEKEAFDFDKLVEQDSLNYYANTALRKYESMEEKHTRYFSNHKESEDIIDGYKLEDNSAMLFLSDVILYANLINPSTNKVKIKDFYETYISWCEEENLTILTRKVFKNMVLRCGNFKAGRKQDGFDCFEYVGDRDSLSFINSKFQDSNLIEGSIFRTRDTRF